MSSDGFILAVVDTLAPGGVLANDVVAPPASRIAVAWQALEGPHASVLAAIAEEAGTRHAFCSYTEDVRALVLAAVETARPQDFAAFVAAALTLYYEAPEVIAAFGWPPRPPQPSGHRLPPFDESLLAPVKARHGLKRRPD
jgi:hypothetical protein